MTQIEIAATQNNSVDLASTPYLVALTKVDVLSEDAELPQIETGNAMGIVSLSSVTRTHLESLLERLWSESQRIVEEERGSGKEDQWWAR